MVRVLTQNTSKSSPSRMKGESNTDESVLLQAVQNMNEDGSSVVGPTLGTTPNDRDSLVQATKEFYQRLRGRYESRDDEWLFFNVIWWSFKTFLKSFMIGFLMYKAIMQYYRTGNVNLYELSIVLAGIELLNYSIGVFTTAYTDPWVHVQETLMDSMKGHLSHWNDKVAAMGLIIIGAFFGVLGQYVGIHAARFDTNEQSTIVAQDDPTSPIFLAAQPKTFTPQHISEFSIFTIFLFAMLRIAVLTKAYISQHKKAMKNAAHSSIHDDTYNMPPGPVRLDGERHYRRVFSGKMHLYAGPHYEDLITVFVMSLITFFRVYTTFVPSGDVGQGAFLFAFSMYNNSFLNTFIYYVAEIIAILVAVPIIARVFMNDAFTKTAYDALLRLAHNEKYKFTDEDGNEKRNIEKMISEEKRMKEREDRRKRKNEEE